MRGDSCVQSAKRALEVGYRLIDTAAGYRNEALVAKALELSKVPREKVFIQTKITPGDQGYHRAAKAIDASIKELGTTYVDLFLIHWPGTQRLALDSPLQETNRLGTWRALEEALDVGKIRSIGVSNFQVKHLESLLRVARIPPAVNQIECHPLYHPLDIIEYCQQHNILIQAYSSLGEGNLVNGSIPLPVLDQIASKHQVPASQVLLQWGMHHGYAVLPKASSEERLISNLASQNVTLSEQDVAQLDQLATTSLARKFCWDSTDVA